MRRGIFLLLIFALVAFRGFSQKDDLGLGEERLVPLRVNAQIAKKRPFSATAAFKSPGPQSYFLLDTLSLPFIDDFSKYKLKSYDTLDYSQMLVVDKMTYDFTVDGLLIDTFICSSDTTWSYLYHNTFPDSLMSKTPLTAFQVIFYNHPADPFAPSDTVIYWDPFEIYDTIVLASTPDTIDSLSLVLDTLISISDTFKVYPPDTSVGGVTNSLWIDEDVFINSTYPIDPITVGVATFDGLNQYGAPHNGFSDPAGYGLADYLTSKPIDLSYTVTDSVYLSFYYQPQGIGNDPQVTDSLVLEFFGPSTLEWYNIWSVPGTSYHKFKQVIFQITDPIFLQDGFQFRFKNYGTLSGNLDHWNLDYVRLNAGRNDADTFIVDVALISATGSVLQNYEAVPWKHYLADTTLPLVADMAVSINNLDTADNNVGYHFNIRHQSNVSTFPLGSNNTVINRQDSANRILPIDISFSSNLTDSAEFEINNYISPPPTDTIENNDTIKYIQRFYNYYAYDDGSAEWAYLLNAPGAKLAYRFTSIIPDTLRAVDIYFSQVIEDVSAEFFYLTIWNSLSPEDIIYQQAFQTPVYEDALNKFHTYLLDEILVLSGTYYIGWVQVTDASLNVGFDKNRDASSFLYYNVSGTWIQSIIDGSVMMRPLFGGPVIIPVGIGEGFSPIKKDLQYRVFPNPAKELVYIQADGNNNQDFLHIMIHDIYGRKVKEVSTDNGIVHVAGLSLGVYFFTIQAGDNDEFFIEKVLINR